MGETYADFGGVEGYAYDSFRHITEVDNAGQYAPTNLFLNLLKNEDFRTKFVNVYCDYANEVLTPEKADAMAAIYSRDYTGQLANTTVRWWGFFGGSKESNLSYTREKYRNEVLPEIQTFFRERGRYTLEDMRNYLGLSSSMQTITLKAVGNGSIRINSITPDASSGWSGSYSPDCPVTLTAVPDDGAVFTGWDGDFTGTETTVTVTLREAMTITANFGERKTIRGDVNGDGSVDTVDLIALQKWLLAVPGAKLGDGKAADLNADGLIDIYDLSLLKRELLILIFHQTIEIV